jgi:nucleotide-binding universal stress UspA family protein
MTTSTDAGRAPAPRATGEERVTLVAGGDTAGYAAARWVARRSRSHPLVVTLVRTDDEGADGERVDRTAEALRIAAPELQVLMPLDTTGEHRIVRAAEDCDLLVLGSNRATALGRHLPPSGAVRLAQEVACPVVLVPSGWQPGGGPIVVGTEGDGSDDAAVRFAVAEAESLPRELVMVHAWLLSPVVTPVFAFALDTTPVREEHAARLTALADTVRARYPSLRLTTALVQGAPPEALVRRAATAELVVVGSHGLSRVDRVLLHSVGRALVRQSDCPVAIVPPHHRRAADTPDAAHRTSRAVRR